MKEKMMRSFFGAFICAMSTIIPASIYNMPYLLIPGGVFGWLVGYHGDRFIDRFKVAYRNSVGIRGRLRLSMEQLQNRIDKVFIFGGAIAGMISMAILGAIFFIPKMAKTIIRWIKNAPANYLANINSHPINKAYRIRNALLLLFSVASYCGVYQLLVMYGPTVGDPVGLMPGQTVPTIKDMSTVTIERGVIFLAYTAIVYIPFVKFYLGENFNQKGFYGIRERYSNGAVQFAFTEFFRILWIQIWWIVSVVFYATYAIVGAFLCVFLLNMFFMITVAGIQATWHTVKANRDYGVISLIIGLVAGVISFYLYRDNLVASMAYRLMVSIATGFGAGIISAFVTFILEHTFRKIKGLSKIVKHGEGEYSMMFSDI